MSKKLYFLISFVLVLCLSGLVRADVIEVNNPSFEYDINGVQITELTGWDAVQGWTQRDTTGWAGGYWFVDDEWGTEGFEAADGTVCSFNVTGYDPCDPETGVCDIYQIIEDANAVIEAGYRYTLTFNALRIVTTDTPIAYGALFYTTGVNVAPANDVVLASKSAVLTSPTWGEAGYAGWEEISLSYLALPGAGSIGETLGVKLSNPYPWFSGYQVAMDNVRVDRVLAVKAYNPYPDDKAKDVAKNVTLGWAPGVKVQPTGGHHVYFGTDETAVQDANTTWAEYQSAEDNNSWSVLNYDAGGLELGRTYYWRVDEVNGSEVGSPWKGEVWSFRVAGYATNPSPYDGEVDVPFLGQSLSWTAGTDATSHDVYLGEDVNAVTDANTNSSEYKGNQAVGNTTYPLTGLTVGKTYYWRIDERSAVHTSGLHGATWSFTIGPFLIVDNFDSYDATEPDLTDVWSEYSTNGSDGAIALMLSDPVRSGKSMMLDFYNTTYTSSKGVKYFTGSWTDAQDMTELEIGSDWTIGGVKALQLFIMGDPCNIHSYDAKNSDWGAVWPWVELEDTSSNVAFVKVDDPNVALDDSWYAWNIDLAIFDACGVTLSAIDRVAIGVGGTRTGQVATHTAAGYLYIEDIRLYPPRCRTDIDGVAYFNSLGDIGSAGSGIDCAVDYFDLDVMATEWLVSDACVSATPPASPPEVWYRFDDGPGSTVVKNDGSWSGYDISIGNPPISDEPAWSTDVAPAIDVCDPNYALLFDGTDDHLDIPNSAASKFVGTQNMSITAWVKPTADMAEWDWPSIVESRKDSNSGEASGFGFGSWGELIYFWNNEYWDWSCDLWATTGEWQFIAVAVEPTQATIYLSDGVEVQSATHIATHDVLTDWDSTHNNLIGLVTSSEPPRSFNGRIDDVRLYNKTLTAGEIDGLAGLSYVPNTSVANIVPKDPPPVDYDPNDPDIVNFLDYAKQADNWLNQFLWP